VTLNSSRVVCAAMPAIAFAISVECIAISCGHRYLSRKRQKPVQYLQVRG
jgi:hypothetical protein